MKVFVALLRAINVGGTGKLAMVELRTLCEGLGFSNVQTYIQSGNVVFQSGLDEPQTKATLEAALAQKMGKPVAVMLRSHAELEAAVTRNPFEEAAPDRVLIYFLDEPPTDSTIQRIVIPARESVKAVGRQVFVHYPEGMGQSKLKLPFSSHGTGRNLNTVRKLIAMAEEDR